MVSTIKCKLLKTLPISSGVGSPVIEGVLGGECLAPRFKHRLADSWPMNFHGSEQFTVDLLTDLYSKSGSLKKTWWAPPIQHGCRHSGLLRSCRQRQRQSAS